MFLSILKLIIGEFFLGFFACSCMLETHYLFYEIDCWTWKPWK